MQHLKLVDAFLVAVAVFQVDALPGGDYATLVHQKDIFSSATPESLIRTFHFEDGVDIEDTLAHILVGLSRDPRRGGIYFIMSDTFLWELEGQKIAPKFMLAWITMCSIINKERAMRDSKATNVEDLIRAALKERYRGAIDPQLHKKFHELAPRISNAMNGDVEESKEIVSELAKLFDDFDQLKNIDGDTKQNILVNVNTKLHYWGDGGLDRFIQFAKIF